MITIWDSSSSDESTTPPSPASATGQVQLHRSDYELMQPAHVSATPLPSIRATKDALQGYEYFQKCSIAAMIAQGPQYPQWIRYALQLSHHPALFYAMAAVGTAQRRK